MRHFFAAIAVLLFGGVTTTPPSAPPKPDSSAAADDDIAHIMGLPGSRRSVYVLETLTETIGGRITGSPESRATAELLLKTLREAGFDNAHFEE
jgi:hypothetical protein